MVGCDEADRVGPAERWEQDGFWAATLALQPHVDAHCPHRAGTGRDRRGRNRGFRCEQRIPPLRLLPLSASKISARPERGQNPPLYMHGGSMLPLFTPRRRSINNMPLLVERNAVQPVCLANFHPDPEDRHPRGDAITSGEDVSWNVYIVPKMYFASIMHFALAFSHDAQKKRLLRLLGRVRISRTLSWLPANYVF